MPSFCSTVSQIANFFLLVQLPICSNTAPLTACSSRNNFSHECEKSLAFELASWIWTVRSRSMVPFVFLAIQREPLRSSGASNIQDFRVLWLLRRSANGWTQGNAAGQLDVESSPGRPQCAIPTFRWPDLELGKGAGPLRRRVLCWQLASDDKPWIPRCLSRRAAGVEALWRVQRNGFGDWLVSDTRQLDLALRSSRKNVEKFDDWEIKLLKSFWSIMDYPIFCWVVNCLRLSPFLLIRRRRKKGGFVGFCSVQSRQTPHSLALEIDLHRLLFFSLFPKCQFVMICCVKSTLCFLPFLRLQAEKIAKKGTDESQVWSSQSNKTVAAFFCYKDKEKEAWLYRSSSLPLSLFAFLQKQKMKH